MGMKEERVPKKTLKEGRLDVPRGRWSDAVDKDAKRMLKCSNWKRPAEGRDA
jgi:hypothetical protein